MSERKPLLNGSQNRNLNDQKTSNKAAMDKHHVTKSTVGFVTGSEPFNPMKLRSTKSYSFSSSPKKKADDYMSTQSNGYGSYSSVFSSASYGSMLSKVDERKR